MDLGLKDKVALVAASSQGLGRAVAEELAAEGASLVLCARDAHTLDQTAAAIAERSNTRVLAVPADVTNADDIKRLVDAGIERFGHIDILVTNAGGPPAGRFDQLTHEQWEQAIRLTLLSAVELTRLVLPGMKERGFIIYRCKGDLAARYVQIANMGATVSDLVNLAALSAHDAIH